MLLKTIKEEFSEQLKTSHPLATQAVNLPTKASSAILNKIRIRIKEDYSATTIKTQAPLALLPTIIRPSSEVTTINKEVPLELKISLPLDRHLHQLKADSSDNNKVITRQDYSVRIISNNSSKEEFLEELKEDLIKILKVKVFSEETKINLNKTSKVEYLDNKTSKQIQEISSDLSTKQLNLFLLKTLTPLQDLPKELVVVSLELPINKLEATKELDYLEGITIITVLNHQVRVDFLVLLHPLKTTKIKIKILLFLEATQPHNRTVALLLGTQVWSSTATTTLTLKTTN